MGYFNSAYEIYSLLCIISITGLPVAMSVLISRDGNHENVERIFSLSRSLFLVLGVASTLILLVFSRGISGYLKSDKALPSILAIAPSLGFVCVTSAYKGYFQGVSDMKPICISGIIEALSKLILGLSLASLISRLGLPNHIVAAFGVLSISIGSFLSFIYFICYKRKFDKTNGISKLKQSLGVTERRRILSDIVKISFPATLSSLMISLVRVVDMIMILRRLQDIGYSSAHANMMYGSYTTMAIPIFSLAAALVSSISVPLIPELSCSAAECNLKEQATKISCAIKLTAYISCPAMIGISLFSREILTLIFKGQTEGIDITTPLLACLGLSVLTSVLITLTNSMLQAYKEAAKPIISMGIGCAIKVILSFLLIGNKGINILGAPIGTFFCDLVICILNFGFLFKCFKGKLNFKEILLEPLFCSALAILPVFFVMRAIQDRFDQSVVTLASIGAAGALYLAFAGRKILKIKELGE